MCGISKNMEIHRQLFAVIVAWKIEDSHNKRSMRGRSLDP
jgi:hypothetical protein